MGIYSSYYMRLLRPFGKWWLAGGISASNCISVYQPKGAASLAASYSNLNNPGTYDAFVVTGRNPPTWDATNGWKFNRASFQVLDTGWSCGTNPNRSAIVRFTNGVSGTSGAVFGQLTTGGTGVYGYSPFYASGSFFNGQNGLDRPDRVAGTDAIAGGNAYEDGIDIGNITTGTTAPAWTMTIGGWAYGGGRDFVYLSVYVQAIAFYNTTITPEQVTALTAAMNAL